MHGQRLIHEPKNLRWKRQQHNLLFIFDRHLWPSTKLLSFVLGSKKTDLSAVHQQISLKLGSGCQNTYEHLPCCRARGNVAQPQHLQLEAMFFKVTDCRENINRVAAKTILLCHHKTVTAL